MDQAGLDVVGLISSDEFFKLIIAVQGSRVSWKTLKVMKLGLTFFSGLGSSGKFIWINSYGKSWNYTFYRNFCVFYHEIDE